MVIARSDLFILIISASLLVVGIVRWQSNMSSLTVAANQPRPAQSAVAVNPPRAVSTNTTMAAPAVATSTATSVNTLTTQAASESTLIATPANATQATTTTAASSDNQTGQPNEPLYGVYIVQSGDFLGRIAEEHGTSVATLRQINNISGSLINVGQEIKYPMPAN